ncbi:hypothetical protein [Microbacterium sp. SORGH_AS_0888]|uniref:hypothetical protein n=1 Tax=Microbacterium sp. SORGH_AS_0888 TaxID=3041791 RepID=UPI00278A02CE|nr:hypothetical protein [Microbacterium sp. SORGH_AS_0888]MDQ1129073.1 hypothetical protein [Microbacterium sp. SORGH_AS_0888]
MTSTEIERLREQVERLRDENAELRSAAPSPGRAVRSAPAGRRWRAWVSALCIVLATLLVPVSVVGGWTRAQLVDEQRFVDTFAPLAKDPAVQALVIDRTSSALDAAIDIDGLTNDLFDGIATLDLPAASQRALGLLRAPAAAGARSAVTSAVTRVVQSDAFATVWNRSLVAAHRALAAAATGGDGDVLAISGSGELRVQLGPVIDEVRSTLAQQGFALAAAIPAIDVSIVVARSDALTLVGPLYVLAATVGFVLPLVAVALFLLGVLVARRRSTAALGTGVGLVLGAGSVAAGVGIGGVALSLQAPALGVPAATLRAVYDAVVGRMQDTAVVLMVLGIVVGLAAWLAGHWAPARRIRAVSSSLTASARRGLRVRGVDTGRIGRWLFSRRPLVRIVLLVLAILVLALATPLTTGVVLGTTAGVLVAWLVLELLVQDPGDAATTAAEAGTLGRPEDGEGESVVVARSAAPPVASDADAP